MTAFTSEDGKADYIYTLHSLLMTVPAAALFLKELRPAANRILVSDIAEPMEQSVQAISDTILKIRNPTDLPADEGHCIIAHAVKQSPSAGNITNRNFIKTADNIIRGITAEKGDGTV